MTAPEYAIPAPGPESGTTPGTMPGSAPRAANGTGAGTGTGAAPGVRFAIVWDKNQSAVKKYSPPNMPTSFIIDKDGKVRHVHAGYHTGEESTISDEIKAILGK